MALPGNPKWKTVPDYYLKGIGGLNFLLRCNYDEKYLTSLPVFYRNILKYFRELKTLYNHSQDQNIILHNNKDILVGDRPFFIGEWYQNGILSIRPSSFNIDRSTNVVSRFFGQLPLLTLVRNETPIKKEPYH